jgi:hypothetical protein
MRQSIRALGWTITISMLILFAFLATAFYSVYTTIATGEGVGLGALQTDLQNDTLVFSMPININNTGYYDMTEFHITSAVKDYKGAVITSNTTEIPHIKSGSAGSATHRLSLSLQQMLTNMTYLLFNDTEFRIDLQVSFRYASAIGLQIDMANLTIPWGAPLHGLELIEAGPPSLDGTHLSMYIVLEVENHSFLDAGGELSFTVFNNEGKRIGSGIAILYVPANSGLSEPIEAIFEIDNPSDYTGSGYLEAYLEIPLIDYPFELGRIDYG